jgi:hypothetical protein
MQRLTRLLPLLLAPLLLAACAPLRAHLPWQAALPPAPVPVRELEVTLPTAAPISIVLQFWERNTLVVDLQAVASTGELRLKPQPGAAWPLRLALRAAPGHFEALEVNGAQRAVYPVGAGRSDLPVTLTVAPSVYQGATPELLLRWGAAASF